MGAVISLTGFMLLIAAVAGLTRAVIHARLALDLSEPRLAAEAVMDGAIGYLAVATLHELWRGAAL